MQVVKRNGFIEKVSFDKVSARIGHLTKKLKVNPILVAQKTINTIYDGITTREIDEQSAKICANMCTDHPDYSKLASNILISNLHKSTEEDYAKVVDILYNNYIEEIVPDVSIFPYKIVKIKKHNPLISRELYETALANHKIINKIIDYERDYNYDFFGFKTLERAYLLQINKKIIERPQHMLMRVALGHYPNDIKMAAKIYDELSQGLYTPATPTLYNCGTPRQQCSSCFVLGTCDSIEGIFKTITDCAKISKHAGGIGLAISDIRAEGSLIRGTNGRSNGIIPMVKVYNEVARYIDQGGGKRKGAFALYLEPWHANIYNFLDLKKNIGSETERARDIFLGLWVPDLFMKRVKNNEMWSLMCPNECKGLTSVHSEEFTKLYEFYEKNGLYVRQVKARELFNNILSAQTETGVPYMMYKDTINRKSNHKNIGVIKGSNLCCEIAIYFDENEYSVCTLASIALPKFVSGNTIDYERLSKIAGQITMNLNRIIDINYYPTEEARISTMNHRPIGIGVQGLADAFVKMKIPFDSVKARTVNKLIFEAIYYGALSMSCELAKKYGPYKLFKNSPFSQGILQFDMWDVKPSNQLNFADWEGLRADIIKYGVRNSLLTAPMPTASTGQILGNSAAFEPHTSNLYLRKTSAGNFIVINKYLINDLIELDLWDDKMRQTIMYFKGSIQNIKSIPKHIKDLYKTASEIKQKVIIDMAVDRGAYIDQTQSMNIFMDYVDTAKLRSIHFYGWQKGLKTGMYYLRSKPVVDAIQFSIQPELVKEINEDSALDEIDINIDGGGMCARNDTGNYVCEACT